MPLPHVTTVVLLALLLPILPVSNAAERDAVVSPAEQVQRLTGSRARLVWLRHKQWETYKGSLDGGVGYSIMAFDTDGKGERELVPEGEFQVVSRWDLPVDFTVGQNCVSACFLDRRRQALDDVLALVGRRSRQR